MNKTQREKLTKLDTQLWQIMGDFRTLLEEERVFLDGLNGEGDTETIEDVVNMLENTIDHLEQAEEYIVDTESVVNATSNQGGEI